MNIYPFGAYCQVMKILREKRGRMSQDALAHAIGQPQSWVSKRERRIRPLSIQEFFEWCGALGVKPDAVIHDALAGSQRPLLKTRGRRGRPRKSTPSS